MDAILQKSIDDAIQANNRKLLTDFLSLFGIDDTKSSRPAASHLEIHEAVIFGLFTLLCVIQLVRLPGMRRRQAKEEKRMEKAKREQKREEIDRELRRTVRDLQAANDALMNSMRESRSSIEQLQASVEELQSAVEELQASEESTEASDEDSQTSDDDSEGPDGESQNLADDGEAPEEGSQPSEEDSPNPSEGSQTPVEDDDSSKESWVVFIDRLDEYVDNCERRLSDSSATAAEKNLEEERQKLIARQDTIIEEVERKAAETGARKKTYPFFNERKRDLYGCMQPPSGVPV